MSALVVCSGEGLLIECSRNEGSKWTIVGEVTRQIGASICSYGVEELSRVPRIDDQHPI